MGQKYLEEALSLVKGRRMQHLLYVIYNELGNLKRRQNRLEQALDYFQHAYGLFQRFPQIANGYSVAHNIAVIYFEKNKFDEAQKYYEYVIRTIHAQKEQDESQAGLELFLSYCGLSACYRQKGEFKKARDSLVEAQILLGKYEFLKSREQRYLDEKAELSKKPNL